MPLTVTTQTTAEISGGRTTTLQPENFDTAQSITVIDSPDHGRLTVNPDNSLALVMTETDYTGSLDFTIEVTDANGATSQQTISMNVVPGSQAAGWATGADHYMLETDDDGELVIETGDNHREVFVSGSADALSVADIAAAEGLQEWQITAQWLTDNPQYGSSADTALDMDAGMMLWGELVGTGSEPSSHWLRFEAGYTYQSRGEDISTRGIQGESPLHPVVITSYGDGEQPVIEGDIYFIANDFSNLVVHDLHFVNTVLVAGPGDNSNNVIFDSITGTQEGRLVVQNVDSFTLHDSNFYNLSRDEPVHGGTWHAFDDRIQGIYAQGGVGLLIEGTRFTEIGWEDGYAYDRSADSPQAPGMFSHAVYVQNDNLDVTFRDNIMGQASSFGAQIRTGGFVEDNLFFDNNAMLNVLGGGDGGPIGHYSLVQGNVVTDAGYRDAVTAGALSLGIDNDGYQTALIGNIVAHLTDPEAPWELDSHFYNNGGLNNQQTAFYDDTIVYNWFSGEDVLYDREESHDRNVGGLDRDLLDQTTMNNLARVLLNDPNATTDDLVQWIQVNEVTADELNAFFQTAFGILPTERTDALDVRFVPDERGDGVRWDNRLNWDSGDIAGSVDGDSVDLGGNLVIYGGTQTISALDMGESGRLEISHGRLDVTGLTTAGATGGEIAITSAGQVWLGGYNGPGVLSIAQDGGRFANTGSINGNVDLVIESGQAILSANGGTYVVGRDEELVIDGADALAGFDGSGADRGTIRFEAGADLIIASDGGGLGSIAEFRSGAFGDNPNVTSRLELGGLDLTVDLTQASMNNGNYLLMTADEVSGTLGSFDVLGLGGRSATVTVNYNTDQVWLNLGSGSGTSINTIGSDQDLGDINGLDSDGADQSNGLRGSDAQGSDDSADMFVFSQDRRDAPTAVEMDADGAKMNEVDSDFSPAGNAITRDDKVEAEVPALYMHKSFEDFLAAEVLEHAGSAFGCYPDFI
ncbi:hypothetical protein [uncultured Tateyamaria sp.]|uniref:Ig-like domain-containing protein n=1 Tax=uncultured Tateyamaria sp. TaxID=455651 RepID=UPI0026347149|nr:hypothetical protein [uncultured Tateyamaria sp.]